ncbi:hypothetical protein GCM10023084_61000 [Streptomyces lacrimifluminis]|uniref:Uncharacterized protein n=1 Tax=Streptomyces lacrimifluminis TaxID=1500077 RepID=A0A917KZ86_9ACTN|nr:hypothetical protein GCM10012282_32370 [Streptomyces lacrimifluminis]
MRVRLLGSVLATVFSVAVAVGVLGGSGLADPAVPPPDSGWDSVQAADPVFPADSGWDSAPVDVDV